MRRRRSKLLSYEEEPTVNLTPLIDVVFVVLIMFMVIAPLLGVDQIALAPGSSTHESLSTVSQSSLLSIRVKQDNTVWVGDNQIDPAHLEAWLRNRHAQHPQAIPQLFHDRRAQFGTYQIVKNAIEQAGYSHMEVILQPT